MPTQLGGAGSSEDDALVARVRSGDREAFDALIRRYQPLADAYARTILDEAPVVEDLVQEAFWKAFRALDQLETPARFGAWLKSILWRCCHDWVRAERSRRQALRAQPPPIVEATDPGGAEDEGEDAYLVRLAEAVASLTLADRQAMALFYLLDEPQERIAAFLEVPLGTVKRRLHDARQRLAASVDGEAIDPPLRARLIARLRVLLTTHLPPTEPSP